MDNLTNLTDEQRDVIEYYRAFNVPGEWFTSGPADDGSVAVIMLGDGFAWSISIDADGRSWTSEATVGPWSSGITV